MADYNLWKNDITNRFDPTSLTDSVRGDGFIATAIINGVRTVSSFKLTRYHAYKDLREVLLNSTIPLPESTTVQRDALKGILHGTIILNITAISIEIYHNGKWISAGGGDIGVWSRNAEIDSIFPTTITDKVGIGTIAPLATLEIKSQMHQLRLSHDATNFTSLKTTIDDGFSIDDGFHESDSRVVSSHDSHPRSMAWNNDGTRMYMVGSTSKTVWQYTVATPFDLSTARFQGSLFSVESEDPDPRDILFNNDGTKMFILGATTATVYQYSLSSPFMVKDATLVLPSFSIATEDRSPRGLAFNSTGTKLFMLGASSPAAVYQYTLPTAFDFTDAVYDGVTVGVGDQDSSPRGLNFNTDGTKMFIVGFQKDSVFQYSLPTPFILTDAIYDNISLDLSGQTAAPRVGVFSTDGEKFYLITGERNIYQYSTASINGLTISPSGKNTIIKGNLTLVRSGKFPAAIDMAVQTDPVSVNPSAGNARFYVRKIDTDNDGVFVKIKKAAGFVEVQIG